MALPTHTALIKGKDRTMPRSPCMLLHITCGAHIPIRFRDRLKALNMRRLQHHVLSHTMTQCCSGCKPATSHRWPARRPQQPNRSNRQCNLPLTPYNQAMGAFKLVQVNVNDWRSPHMLLHVTCGAHNPIRFRDRLKALTQDETCDVCNPM